MTWVLTEGRIPPDNIVQFLYAFWRDLVSDFGEGNAFHHPSVFLYVLWRDLVSDEVKSLSNKCIIGVSIRLVA